MSISRVLRSRDENFLSLKSQVSNSSQSFHCRCCLVNVHPNVTSYSQKAAC